MITVIIDFTWQTVPLKIRLSLPFLKPSDLKVIVISQAMSETNLNSKLL